MKSDNRKNQTYSYSDFYSEYFFHNTDSKPKPSPEHTLVFVFSGELIVQEGIKETKIQKGEYIFLRKDTNIILERNSGNGESFSSIFIGLNRNFLGEFYRLMNKERIPKNNEEFPNSVIELPRSPCMDSMYVSLMPYFEWNKQPTKAVLEIKLIEAVFSLLYTDQKFYHCLFGFLKPWIPDLYTESSPHSIYSKIEKYYFDNNIIIPTNDKAKLLCLLKQPRLILHKNIETAYIRKKKGGRTSDIYIEVNYHDDTQLIEAIHNHYNTCLPN